jgi:D-glycero-D-manno-heptose 1,7-bisphosphate phosphatase
MKAALFLDRDGVINVEKNYVYRIEDFEFIDGIFELCKTAQDLSYAIVVITNQAGIGRGYYTEAEFHHLNDWMVEQFLQRGIHIDGVYFCPYHPTGGVGEYRRESYDRKPNPGMLLRAQVDLGLDLENSVLVGDKVSDMEAARSAGITRLAKLTGLREESHQGGCQDFSNLNSIAQWLALET